MSTPRTIAGMDFPTQKAAIEHCQDLVKRWYSRRQRSNRRRFTRREVPIIGEDRDFAEALFDRHPEHDQKLEEALDRGFSGDFCVAPSEYGSLCLCLLTQTRPLVEFSYRRAIREPDAAEGETQQEEHGRDRRERPARSSVPATSRSWRASPRKRHAR